MNTQQSLENALNNESTTNYNAIFDGFMDMGINPQDIRPRENVFTYNAWKALGRQVAKGQHGVKVVTYVAMSKKDENGEKNEFRRPKTTTVFHVSQTEAIEGAEIIKPEHKPKMTTVKKANTNGSKFRVMAEKLQSQIDDKLGDRLTNTPKRVAQAAHARLEGERLLRTQKALEAMADLIDADSLPSSLSDITSKKAVYELMGADLERISNGYHDYMVDTGNIHASNANNPQAIALWSLLTGKTEEEKKADELKQKIQGLQFSNIPGYFPTPSKVVDIMLDYVDIQPDSTILEPNIGSAYIADRICETYGQSLKELIQGCEVNYTLADISQSKGYNVIQGDFLAACIANGSFDYVLMNPPFEKMQDIDHVNRAYHCLKSGGRLVSVMSAGVMWNTQSKAVMFRDWVNSIGGEFVELPENSFKESNTGVNTCLVIIDRN